MKHCFGRRFYLALNLLNIFLCCLRYYSHDCASAFPGIPLDKDNNPPGTAVCDARHTDPDGDAASLKVEISCMFLFFSFSIMFSVVEFLVLKVAVLITT